MGRVSNPGIQGLYTMKILQINKFFYIKGGPERCMFNTAEILKKKGHEIAFFSMRHPDNFDTIWNNYFVSNVEFNKKSSSKEKLGLFFNTLYSREAAKNLDKLISDFKPDLAHIHNFNHQLTPSILSPLYKNRIPIVITLHDYKLVCPSYSMLNHGRVCELCKGQKFFHSARTRCHKDSFSASFLATLESYLHHQILGSYKKVNCFISPSKFLIHKCKEMGLKGEYVYLPNFIDVKNMTPKPASESNAITYCGKLSEEKGISTLVRAVKGLKISLNALGDGPLKEELQEYATNNGIDNAYFLGHLNGDRLFRTISDALFAVVPSEWYENNPFSILEAFALGKPVIGSKIGGIPELIEDGITGFTFEPGNIKDLRSKIGFMISNKDKVLEMGRNARRLIEEEFDAETHYQKLIEIYKEAIGN